MKGCWVGVLLLGLLALPAQAERNFVVGFAQDTLANDWRIAQVMEVKRALEAYPEIDFIYTDAQGDTALQAMHIDDLVRHPVDVLITSPRDRHLLAPAVEAAHAQGIPVILLTRDVATESYTSFVTLDNRAIGQAAARFVVEHLEGAGEVLMLEGVPNASTSIERGEGFMQALAGYPEIRVTQRTANFLRADAIQVMDRLLQEGRRFDAVYSQSDSMLSGVRMSLTQAGIAPGDWLLIGIDYITEARDAIAAGEQTLSFTFPTGGAQGAQLAVDLLQGRTVPRQIQLDSIPVTLDNLHQVEPIF